MDFSNAMSAVPLKELKCLAKPPGLETQHLSSERLVTHFKSESTGAFTHTVEDKGLTDGAVGIVSERHSLIITFCKLNKRKRLN